MTCTQCEREVYSRGLCSRHYQRWLKTADSSQKRKRGKNGSGTVRSDGYRQIRKTGHPLADPNGIVFEHRWVLYEKIGCGPSNCFYCGVILTWGVNLQCDHLDHDRSNNNPENLVPCCPPCNKSRWNKAKTGCPKEDEHGPYDKQYKNGTRYCSKCKCEKENRRREKLLSGERKVESRSDTCFKGHPYDIFTDTGPKCSICRKENRRLYKERTGK